MSKILIIGGSSGIGLSACRVALESGHHVVAFSRHAEDINIQHENLTKFNGDALNYDDVSRAMADVDVVLQTLGVPMNLKLITGPISLFSKATEVMLKVMNDNKVKRLLVITGFGAGDSVNSIHPLQKIGFNMVFGRAYADKTLQETQIKNSQLDWTIVRPGVLLNCLSSKPCKVLKHQHEWKNGAVSRSKVAEFMINSIDDESMIHQAPVLIS